MMRMTKRRFFGFLAEDVLFRESFDDTTVAMSIWIWRLLSWVFKPRNTEEFTVGPT
jgi:hypothetical protein